jgi:hypothetical protein
MGFFICVVISLKTVQMLIGSRQDAPTGRYFEYATGAAACPCSRGLSGPIDFGPTGMFESMILATSSGILLESSSWGGKLHVVA